MVSAGMLCYNDNCLPRKDPRMLIHGQLNIYLVDVDNGQTFAVRASSVDEARTMIRKRFPEDEVVVKIGLLLGPGQFVEEVAL